MLYIAGDKHGYKAILLVENYLKKLNIRFENLGVKTEGQDMKLEEMIPKVVTKIVNANDNLGILSCGTGIGVEVGANKFGGIRACLASNEKLAEWSRVYDNCNVLCLAGWESDEVMVNKILDAWFSAKYDGNIKRSEMFKVFSEWH